MNTMTVWKPFQDDFFGIDRMLDNIYSNEKHNLNVKIDTLENGDYIIKAEVPGIKEEDLTISYENDTVTIEADYKEEDNNAFRSGKYSRSFQLRDINAEDISAQLSDGVLNITLPRAEEKKARKIQITAK